MSKAEDLLIKLVNFIEEEFCETGLQNCDECSHYDSGNCPVILANQYLADEGYSEDE